MTTTVTLLIVLVCLIAVIAICAVVIASKLGKPAPINVVTVPGTAVPVAPAAAPVYAAAPAPVAAPAAAPAVRAIRMAGDVKLGGVPDRVAAQLMAIVAEESGIPLEELRFISIRERG